MLQENFSFLSANGVNTIHGVLWLPDSDKYAKPLAVLQVSHGMIEYIERYEPLASFFTEKGFAVVGNDHIGHGKSVRSEEDWGYFGECNAGACIVQDLHQITRRMKKRFPGVPYYLLGHSMGSFMARRYMMTFGKELDGVILLGTGSRSQIELQAGLVLVRLMEMVFGSRHRSRLADWLMFGMYNQRITNPRTKSDWICAEESVVEQYVRTPACTFLFTLNGIEALLKSLAYIERQENIARIPKTLPVFIASGLEDPVGNYGVGVVHVRNRLKLAGVEKVSLHLYDGCRHELHNEAVKDVVYQEIYQWMKNIEEVHL